jgi:hypothetical protein
VKLWVLTLIAPLTVSVAASAAPIMPTPTSPLDSNIIQTAGGCGPGLHPNGWGDCVPNGYGYRGYHHYYGGPYPYRGHGYGYHHHHDYYHHDYYHHDYDHYH